MINARSERLHESPVFRRLVPTKRCVVVMNGFYEWHKESSRKKQPYYVHRGEEKVVKFAALYDRWESKKAQSSDGTSMLCVSSLSDEGDELYTVSIVTTSSNRALDWLHDRMPVMLPDEKAVDQWLTHEGKDWQPLKKLLRPYPVNDLLFHPVTEQMGKVTFQGKECCLDIRKRGLAAFCAPKKEERMKRTSPESKYEDETQMKKKVKTEIKTESKALAKEEQLTKSVKTESPMDTKKESTDRKRDRPLRSMRSSPLRKSPRLLAKALKKE